MCRIARCRALDVVGSASDPVIAHAMACELSRQERSMDRRPGQANRWQRLVVAWLVAGSCMALSARAQAQGAAAIAGRVTDARTALPAVGALVAVEGTALRGVVGSDGRYRIANVPAGSHTVRVTVIGYSDASQTVQVAAEGTVLADFTLQPQAIALEEIVVSGTAG